MNWKEKERAGERRNARENSTEKDKEGGKKREETCETVAVQ